MKHETHIKIAIPTIVLLVAIAFTASPASAGLATNLHGYCFFEDDSPAYVDSARIINTNTSEEWNSTTSPSLVWYQNYYQLTLDDPDDVTTGNILHYIVTNGTWTNDSTATYTGLDFEYNITFNRALPDLIVESITPNCGGYLFANESNEICAKITNDGTVNTGEFNVSFEAGVFSAQVRVTGGLAAGANTTICVTDPTLRSAGESVTINVTADCNDEVDEGASEGNNVASITKTVVNNGYKGKRYTGGSDITTWQTFELQGNLLYSVGDSYYLSSYSYPNWAHYTVNWTASDLPVPGTATVKEARLYVPYTWAKNNVMQGYMNLTFNGNLQTLDYHYWDEKGFGSSYPYGMLVYNVTADFSTSGNLADLANSYPTGGQVSMRGMVLVVIYEDDSELEKKILINEEFDLLYGGSSQCTTAEEATAYAPFAGSIDLAKYKWAKLITIAPGAGPDEGELLFNGQTWTDVWNYAGSTQIGIDERDVSSYLQATNNTAGFQSSGDYMEASNAFLVLTTPVIISVEPEETMVAPQSQFDIDITVNPNGASVYGVEYYLNYDPSVIRAEVQNKGSFLGGLDDTIVLVNEIDQVNGKVSYAETRKGSGGVTDPGALATIQFTAIGARGAASDLDLDGVIIVNAEDNEPFAIIEIEDGTVTINDNAPPVASACSKHRINNAAKKFQCSALLCSNSYDPNGEITYLRWAFGDGQYGTSEGNVSGCACKEHKYESWQWVGGSSGYYEPFTASITVTDNGDPELTDTYEFPVTVYMAGDANGDGRVNILDAVQVGKNFGQSCPGGEACGEYKWSNTPVDAADLNNDCEINILDAVIIGTMWGHTAW